jgi:hypothetical protein
MEIKEIDNDNFRLTSNMDDNSELLMKTFKCSGNWIPDDSVDKCLNCKKTFGIFLRKHHCRLCGYIFCGSCLRFSQKIPKEMLPTESLSISINDYISGTQYDEKRICISCNELMIKMKQVEKIVKVFEIIELDIIELHNATKKNTLWKDAAEICINKIKNIQSKLAFDKYTQSDCDILWRNAKYFSDHNCYLTILFKICKTDEDVEKVINIMEKKSDVVLVNHVKLFCKKKCNNKLTSIDAVNILVEAIRNNNDSLKKMAFKYLICDDNEFKCYIPLIVYNIKFDMSGILIDELNKRCFRNLNLLNAVHIELGNYVSDLNVDLNYKLAYDKFINNITLDKNKFLSTKLMQSNIFINIIKKIGTAVCEENRQVSQDEFKITSDLLYPLDIRKNISKIIIDDIKVKESATRPIIIPCEMPTGKRTHLMYKQDNVRQDQIMMHIINLINIIIKKDLGIDLSLITYNILPISHNSGIIEIVDNADTIYYIQQKLKSNILNYMLEKNDKMTIGEFRDKYIKSVAGYSVFTYLFGIGDRHLDNIMVNRDGRLFHIDFGFILGRDPIFNNPGIRITPDMIDALGGIVSKNYIEFQKLSTDIYNSLRNNIDIFINMLTFLQKITNNTYNEKEIKAQILKRFIPGENVIDAKFHLVSTMEKQSVTDRIKDFCHLHKKEKTLSSGIDRLSKATVWIFPSISNLLNNRKYLDDK